MTQHVLKDLNDINKEFEKFLGILNSKDYDKKRISQAFEFAKKAHAFQRRKSGEPYISHPLEVAMIVHEIGLDENSIITALLHDVVEDTQINIKEINEKFGKEIGNLVEGLTKIGVLSGVKDKHSNSDLKDIQSLRKILLASAKDIRILIIKLCDRLHNMRTISGLDDDKIKRIARETLLIYVPIAQKIGMYSLKWELEDLSFKYRNPSMYQFIKEKLNMKRQEREDIVKKAVVEIKSFLKNYGFNSKDVIVLGRPKNFYSIYKKIKDKAKSFEDLYDLYAIRIITKDIASCYSILGVFHEHFQSFPNRLKDYIANPKANGYQSIHTVIYSRTIKCPVEIQIRTEEMHKLAEFGIAAHWRYKNLKEDKKFEKKISWLREVLQWEKEHKDDNEFLKLLKFDFFEDEIFVFTPKNDIITIGEGSTALDFAYAVHTDIGNKAYKAKINGCISTIDKELKSGDIVEIIINKSSKPHEKWLSFVRTSKARSKIRDAIHLKHSGKQNVVIDEISFEKLKDKIPRLKDFKKSRKAKCCSIEYGDQIVGVIGKDKDVVVHKASCENAKFTINQKFQLNWEKENDKEITINMVLKDRYGILIDILNIFSEFNLNVSKLNTKVQKDGSVKMEIKVLDGPHIDKLTERLKDLDAIDNVKIIRGLFF